MLFCWLLPCECSRFECYKRKNQIIDPTPIGVVLVVVSFLELSRRESNSYIVMITVGTHLVVPKMEKKETQFIVRSSLKDPVQYFLVPVYFSGLSSF